MIQLIKCAISSKGRFLIAKELKFDLFHQIKLCSLIQFLKHRLIENGFKSLLIILYYLN